MAAIEASLRPLGDEDLPVAAALGRLTASPTHAELDVPRFDASAMDGFALASADTIDASVALPLGAPHAAGQWPEPLAKGSAVSIATGAPVPAGADAVIILEEARLLDRDGRRWLQIERPVSAHRNVRALGEDAMAGEEIVPAGRLVTPDMIGALISYGVGHVRVRRQPRIGLISTGDEIVPDPGGLQNPATIIDSNGPMIDACCRQLGLSAHFLGWAADRGEALDAMFDAVGQSGSGDIVISTGGVSAGPYDLVAEQLSKRGASIVFHGVRMRPGKPILFAILPDGRPYFGLPGNPVAALVGFRFFVNAAIRRLVGLPPEAGVPADVQAKARPDTTLFLRGVMQADGPRPWVDVDLDQRSHIQRSVLAADTWLRLDPEGPPIAYPKNPSLAP